MNEPIREQVSALMDGELDGDRLRFLLARADAEPDIAQRWTRYQYAAQVLRRERPPLLRDGFAEAVLASIAAPATARPRLAQRVLRWGTGGAIAASVAVAALVVTRPAGESPASPQQPALARTSIAAAMPSPAASIAAAPASITTSSFGTGEIRPPLLAPNGPLDAAPASYGMETTLVPSLDPRFGAYARRAQPAPSVLLLMPAQQRAPESAGAH